MQANQTWLHQKIKAFYSAKSNAAQEAAIDIQGQKYRIDVLDEQQATVYEIQLSNFGKEFSKKVETLLNAHFQVIIVHPVAVREKVIWIANGGARRSRTITKRSDVYSLFDELVHFKTSFIPEQMGFDVLLTEEAVWKEFFGFRGRTRRPRYRQVQRDLLDVRETRKFRERTDFLALLPKNLPAVFTNRELAEGLDIKGGERRKRRIAGRLTYSFSKLGLLDQVGINKRAHEFAIREVPSGS
ncbi:MAG: hypothetical protein ACFFB3_11285 [Candidatus Hodarchaeota archaeon]